MKLAFLGIFLIALLSNISIAASDNSAYLSARAEKVGCTVAFHASVLRDTSAKVSQASDLKDWITKLDSDQSQLNTLAIAGDHKALQQFFSTVLKADLKSADAALRDLRKNFKQFNVSRETREALKNDYKSAKTAFDACVSQADMKAVQKKIDSYSNALDRAQADVEKLSKKGADTSEMSKLITDAKQEIINPLKDPSTGNAELKKYCLWNGCKEGLNFHFAARFAVAKLSAMLRVFSEKAASSGNLTDITAVQTHMDAANTLLSQISTQNYLEGQKDDVWSHINMASDELRKLLKSYTRDTNARVTQ